MMTWSKTVTVEKRNFVKETHGMQDNDEVRSLKGDEKAQVEVLVGTSLGFGEAKVHVAVRLTCNQDQATIYRATQLAQHMAKDLCLASLEDIAPPVEQPNPQPPSPTYGVPR